MTSAPIYAVDDLLYFDIASNALTWVHGDGFAHMLRTPATTAPTAGVEDPTYRPGARFYSVRIAMDSASLTAIVQSLMVDATGQFIYLFGLSRFAPLTTQILTAFQVAFTTRRLRMQAISGGQRSCCSAADCARAHVVGATISTLGSGHGCLAATR